MDVPVTVSIFLECADDDEQYSYEFIDESGHEITVLGHQTAGTTFIFSDSPGIKIVQVTAYLLNPVKVKVATGSTVIEVHGKWLKLLPLLLTVIKMVYKFV